MDTRIARTTNRYTPFTSTLAREVEEFRNRARQLLDAPMSAWMRPSLAPTVAQVVDWYPAAEVAENDRQFTVSMELPGMKAPDVSIDFMDNVLTVRGEKAAEREEKDAERKLHVWERSYGSFQRAFELPTGVDGDKVTAEFADGVLRVVIPKRPDMARRGRRIEIRERKADPV